jgi:hypothetical protein
MTDVAPKPNPTTSGPGSGPGPEEPQGSLGAVLIGGAILLIAGLLIFWPGSDSASKTGAGADGKGAGVQGSNVAGGGPGGGLASGIKPREVDPAEGRTHSQAAFAAPTNGLAMMPTSKPEPTSFPSAAAEIAYFEKKLEQAERDLVSRTTFLERMKRIQEKAPISEHDRNVRRAKIVQENYDKAVARVAELEKKIAELRAKQTGG